VGIFDVIINNKVSKLSTDNRSSISSLKSKKLIQNSANNSGDDSIDDDEDVDVDDRDDHVLRDVLLKSSKRNNNSNDGRDDAVLFTTFLEKNEEKIILDTLEKDTLEEISINYVKQDSQRDKEAIKNYQGLFSDEQNEKGINIEVVCSKCNSLISIPKEIIDNENGFRCGVCGVILHISKDSDNKFAQSPELRNKFALIRWIVREIIYQEVDRYLSTKITANASSIKSSNSLLIENLKLKIVDFPMFRDDKNQIKQAFNDVFELLPIINQQIMKTNKRGMNRRLVNIIAGPIYSTAIDREIEKAGIKIHSNENFHHVPKSRAHAFNELKELFSEFVSFVTNTTDGLETILEAIKSSHSIRELPQILQDLFERQKLFSVFDIINSMAKSDQKSKLKNLYKIFPRRTFIKILKWNLGGKAIAGAGFKILIARPFGSHSLLQRMVAETVGIKAAQQKFAYASQFLSESIQKKLTKFAELYCNDEHDIQVDNLSHDDIISALSTPTGNENLSSKEISEFKSSPDSLLAAKDYLINHVFLRDAILLVELCGDDKITNLFSKIIPAMQSHLMSAATAKSSGLVELFETLFQGWRRIIKADSNKELTKIQIEAIYTDVVARIQDSFFILIHNLLRNDQSGVLHNSISWIFGTWKEASFDLGIDELLNSLPPNLFEAVMSDAEKARIRYEENQNRPPGAPRLPEVKLENASHLIGPISQNVLSKIFPSVNNVKIDASMSSSELSKAKRSSLVKIPASISIHTPNRNSIITCIEVLYDYEDSSTLKSRGYIQLQHNMNHGSNGDGCYLWYRRSSMPQIIEQIKNQSNNKRLDLSPISSLTFAGAGDDERTTIDKSYPIEQNWIRVPKDINKGSGTRLFFVYQRNNNNDTEALIDLQTVFEGDQDDIKKLLSKGYRLVGSGPCNVGRFFLTSRLFIYALYTPIHNS